MCPLREPTIAFRSLIHGKKITAIISIVLCAVLFTALITTFSNVLASIQESEYRIYGTDCHIAAKGLGTDDYTNILNDDAVSSGGYSIAIGRLNGSVVDQMNTEVRYTDEYYAKHTFQYPSAGRLPYEKFEVALSSKILNAYNKKVGDSIELEIVDIHEKTTAANFTIVGTWESDSAINRESAWVSLEWCETYFSEQSYQLECLFMLDTDNSNLLYHFNQLTNRFPSNDFSLNPAHSRGVESGVNTSLVAVMACALFVFLCAFLIIHNVFNISIMKETHEYGMLKALGCTTKQIEKIVNFKVLYMCLTGIPIGIFLGICMGIVLTPYISVMFQSSLHQSYTVHPLSVIVATLFSLLTVVVSTRKPLKLAGAVPPIEAMNYVENLDENSDENSDESRESKRVSPTYMAKLNLRRTKKRFKVTVASLALSLVVLNITTSLIFSFSFNAFVEEQIVSDFSVKGNMVDREYGELSYSEIPQNTVDDIKENFEITNGGSLYYSLETSRVSQEKVEEVTEYMKKYAQRDLDISYKAESVEYEIYGLNEWLQSKLQSIDGSKITTNQGEVFLILPPHIERDTELPYREGDSIILSVGKNEREFKVAGVVTLPSSIHVSSFTAGTIEILMSDEDFKSLEPNANPIMFFFDADINIHNSVQQYLDNTFGSNTDIQISSRLGLKETFQDLLKMVKIVGGAMVGLLLVIGILNFVNSECTSILTRMKELAILEAIGMSRKQCMLMLTTEGVYYIIVSGCVALIIGTFAEFLIVEPIAKMVPFLKHTFSLFPILICLMPMIVFACVIPIFYYSTNRRSVIENIGHST